MEEAGSSTTVRFQDSRNSDGGGATDDRKKSRRLTKRMTSTRKSTMGLTAGRSLITEQTFTISATKALFGADFDMNNFRTEYLDTEKDLDGLSEELKRRKMTCETTLQEVLAGSDRFGQLAHFCSDARTLEKEVQKVNEALVNFQDMIAGLQNTKFGFEELSARGLNKVKSWEDIKKEEVEREMAQDIVAKFQNEWQMKVENQKFKECMLLLRETKRNNPNNKEINCDDMQAQLVQAIESDIRDLNVFSPDLYAMLVQAHGSIHHASELFFKSASTRLKRCAIDINPAGDRIPYLKQYLNAFIEEMQKIMSEFQIFSIEINNLGLDLLLREANEMDSMDNDSVMELKNMITRFKEAQPSQSKDVSNIPAKFQIKTFVEEIINEDFGDLESETIFFAPLLKTQSLFVVWACRQTELLLQFFRNHIFISKEKSEVEQCITLALEQVERLSESGIDLKMYLKLQFDLEFDVLKMGKDAVSKALRASFLEENWENRPFGDQPFTKSGHVLVEQIRFWLKQLKEMQSSGTVIPPIDTQANTVEFVNKYSQLVTSSASINEYQLSQYALMCGSLRLISEIVLVEIEGGLSQIFGTSINLLEERNSLQKCSKLVSKRCGKVFAQKWIDEIFQWNTNPRVSQYLSQDDESNSEDLQPEATPEMESLIKRISETCDKLAETMTGGSTPEWITLLIGGIVSALSEIFISNFGDRTMESTRLAFDMNLFFAIFSNIMEQELVNTFQTKILDDMPEVVIPNIMLQPYEKFKLERSTEDLSGFVG